MLMGFVRTSLIVLVTTVTALAGALDGCLLDCHPQPPIRDVQARAHAHCHPPPAQQAGTRFQADPTCHHDHDAAAAESAARQRVDARGVVLVAPFTVHPESPVASTPSAARSTTDRRLPVAARIPLRV